VFVCVCVCLCVYACLFVLILSCLQGVQGQHKAVALSVRTSGGVMRSVCVCIYMYIYIYIYIRVCLC
jgi:hypothetical protein